MSLVIRNGPNIIHLFIRKALTTFVRHRKSPMIQWLTCLRFATGRDSEGGKWFIMCGIEPVMVGVLGFRVVGGFSPDREFSGLDLI